MSFDLAIWYQEVTPTPEEAFRTYDQLTDGFSEEVAPHKKIAKFHHELLSNFPELTSVDNAGSPFASPVEVTDNCVILSISWSRSEETSSRVIEIACSYGLTVYDPQNNRVYRETKQ